MSVKIVDADAPANAEKKLVRIYKPLPMIPREEALRMRRAARNAADVALPWAVQQLVELAQDCEDPSVKHKVLMDIIKISLSGKSNEEVDPDAPTIDGKVVKESLAELEKATENALNHSGDPDGE